MHLHVAHGSVLLFQTALEMSQSATKERQLVEACIAVAQWPPEEVHLQPDVVSVDLRILDAPADFISQFRSQSFVCIHEKNPIVGERQRVHGPLAFFGPSAVVVELHNLGTEAT